MMARLVILSNPNLNLLSGCTKAGAESRALHGVFTPNGVHPDTCNSYPALDYPSNDNASKLFPLSL
ncbi:MAG: hypothetical protein OEU36_17950 [Gammaproteobacteria bacterium]|nr:hypothetical protein [Gammaproteobacteria bacterium]